MVGRVRCSGRRSGARVARNTLVRGRAAGISRDSRHKRRETGGKRAKYRKKRKFEMGRQPANTKLGHKRVHPVRCRGGNMKYRALRLDTGNFSWGTEGEPHGSILRIVSCGQEWGSLFRGSVLTVA